MYFITFVIELKDGTFKKIKLQKTYSMKQGEIVARLKIDEYFKKFEIEKIRVNFIDIKNLKVIEYRTDHKRNIEVNEKSYKPQAKTFVSKLRKSDLQQKRVYKWEDDNFSKYGYFTTIYSTERMTKFVNYILDGEDIPRLKVNYMLKGNCCFFRFDIMNANNVNVNFLTSMLNKFLAIHELTHYIVHYKNLPDAGHGKYFVGIYAYLLIKYINFDKEGLYKSLESRKIEHIDYNVAYEIMNNNLKINK